MDLEEGGGAEAAEAVEACEYFVMDYGEAGPGLGVGGGGGRVGGFGEERGG